MTTAALEPDRASIEVFVNALLRYAGNDGFISLRAFLENESTAFQSQLWSNRLNGKGLTHIVASATDIARRAANNPQAAVFCPPLAVFSNPTSAKEADLKRGLGLSVELDRNPTDALARVESVLGTATCVVRSGGIAAEGEPKLHAHWRLSQPAEDAGLAKLKQARRLATAIAGGDTSNVPVVHPIRWPGSWHRKAEPRLCEIQRVDPDVEIDLDEALAALTAAAPEEKAEWCGNGADH